jgi:hypothetical protein
MQHQAQVRRDLWRIVAYLEETRHDAGAVLKAVPSKAVIADSEQGWSELLPAGSVRAVAHQVLRAYRSISALRSMAS